MKSGASVSHAAILIKAIGGIWTHPPTNRLFAKSWMCMQCRQKTTITEIGLQRSRRELSRWFSFQSRHRNFSSSQRRVEDVSTPKGSQHELPSKQEHRRSQASKKISHMMDDIQTNIFVAGQRLNDLTGYSAIEALKNEIQKQESLVETTREQLREAKDRYTQAVNQRSQSQREVNELLQRKHAWSPADLERFTSLYRSDHANEQAEAEAQAAVADAERAAEEASVKLSSNILARYHEEQIWSDKIRRMSTWGTWGLMGVNVLLFLVFQIGVEPWRRKRLVKGFEEKVVEALEKETAAQKSFASAAAAAVTVESSKYNNEAIDSAFTDRPVGNESIDRESISTQSSTIAVPPVLDTQTGSTKDILESWTWKENWKEILQVYQWKLYSLFSNQPIQVRQIDITTKYIEGALSSAVVISLLAAAFRNR